MEETDVRQRIAQYIERARMVLNSGELVLEHEDYITAVNRAYYAIFYAANAMLATRGLERSKHSGVIATFRQHFVKTGVIEVEYSDFYGATMEDRHIGDYALQTILDREVAKRDLERARRFVARIEKELAKMEMLE